MKGRKKWLSKLWMGLIFLFFYAPIAYIVVFSFNSGRSLTRMDGFSLQWYERMFSNGDMMDAMFYTILVAVIATVVSTIIGTVAAIGLSKSSRVLKTIVERNCNSDWVTDVF